jgi:hypothetical protein
MTSLDDLLSAAGRVDEITPGRLRDGRAALDSSVSVAIRAAGPAAARPSRLAWPAWPAWPARFGLRRQLALGGIAVAACAALIIVPGPRPRRRRRTGGGSVGRHRAPGRG